MKTIAAVALVLAVFFLLGAAKGGSASGLRGTVVISPGYPVCIEGSSCTRPAAHALLRFWRNGRVVAHTRTDAKGRFRIALAARRYRVTSMHGRLTPIHVKVATDRYRRVTFSLDIGIRAPSSAQP